MSMPSVLDRLAEMAACVPHAPAVVEEGRVTDYAAFVARVRAFATAFAETEQPRVLIASEKGADTYAAMFGALLAGGTYVPANVGATRTRLRAICEAFVPHVVIAAEPLAAWFADLCDARILDPGASLAESPLDVRSSSPIAYVIFTSGSTGVPKGVAIPRTALDHYAGWLGPALDIKPGDRISQHPNIGFDLSVLDIYGALCFGAALHPFVGQKARLLPARKVLEDGITIWNSVPSVVSLIDMARELDALHFGSVRLFTFCGEVLRADHVAKLFAARPNAIVLNTYGPTEATVAMTCRTFTADTYAAACTTSAPIGDAIGDMGLHLVGEDDDEGEIVITGPQLAAFYWQDAALTHGKFRAFTLDGVTQRAFYTGDYAKRIGGDLYFLGRRDEMVKIRGHRIDLGEVRSAFRKIGWDSAFVFESEGALHAAVEGGDATITERRMLADLSAILESYALPKTIRRVARLPRNSNDKIDAAAVRRLFESAESQQPSSQAER